MTDRRNTAGHGGHGGHGGAPYAPAGTADSEVRTTGSAKGAARGGKSYDCPGEDTGYDFEELDRGQN